MAERTRYLKETPKGVSEMCKVMEDVRQEGLFSSVLSSIKKLMETMGFTIEQAMTALKVLEEEKQKYRNLLKQQLN